MRRYLPILWVLIWVMGACAQSSTSGNGGNGQTTTADKLSRDDLRQRMRRYQHVKFHQRQFYVGIAEGSNLAQATRQAKNRIRGQLKWLPRGADHLLRGLYRVARSGTDNNGRVHVLAVLDREMTGAHLGKLAKQADGAADAQIDRCVRLYKASELAGAKSCARKTGPMIRRARDLYTAARAAVGDPATTIRIPAADRLAKLRSDLSDSQARRRWVMIQVIDKLGGNRPQHNITPYTAAATGAGWKVVGAMASIGEIKRALASSAEDLIQTARLKRAGLLLVGKVKASFSGEEDGFFYAQASGRLRLYNVVSGRILSELTVPGLKAGHISRGKAVNKAANQVRQRLKRKLVTALQGSSF
jgi:hypothetical protein